MILDTWFGLIIKLGVVHFWHKLPGSEGKMGNILGYLVLVFWWWKAYTFFCKDKLFPGTKLRHLSHESLRDRMDNISLHGFLYNVQFFIWMFSSWPFMKVKIQATRNPLSDALKESEINPKPNHLCCSPHHYEENLWRKTLKAALFRYNLKAVIIFIIIVTTFYQAQVQFVNISKLTKAW